MDDNETHGDNVKVESIQVTPNAISARVMAGRIRPYQVKLSLPSYSDEEWETVLHLLTAEASYSAALLNDEMPDNLVQNMSDVGITLLPSPRSPWSATCTCSNEMGSSSNVANNSISMLTASHHTCIHIAGVVDTINQRLGRDPLLLFELRGMPRAELMARLRAIRSSGAELSQSTIAEEAKHDLPNPTAITDYDEADKRNVLLSTFWSVPAEAEADSPSTQLTQPIEQAALLMKGKEPEFWTQNKSLHSLLSPVYKKVSERALDLAATYKEVMLKKEDE